MAHRVPSSARDNAGSVTAEEDSSEHPSIASDVISSQPLVKIGGLQARDRLALKRRRISTTERLLTSAGNAEKRSQLAQSTGIAPDTLLSLVQRADLSRIKGIGTAFTYLLAQIGIVNVQGLAQAEPGKLREQLHAVNQQEQILRRAPTLEEVESWVSLARRIEKLVTY